MRNSLINRALVAKTKIFNYALLAAALLVGVNVNAKTVQVSTAADLQTAINAASTGDVIEITGNQVDINYSTPLYMSKDIDLTLNLNGHRLVFENKTAQSSQAATAFILYKGILRVKGGDVVNATPVKEGKYAPVDGNADASLRCFYVLGTKERSNKFEVNATKEQKLASYTTQLWIAEDVFVDCTYGKNGIELYHKMGAQGDAEAVDNGQAAFGAFISIAGTVHGEKYGIQVSGNIGNGDKGKEQKAVPAEGEDARDYNYPWFVVEKTAEVYSNAETTVQGGVGIYMGGFGILDIYGYVHGATGVYVKNGDVEIEDAVIASDYTGTFTPATNTGSSVEGGGSAVVIVTNGNTYGDIDVTISGDTKITGGSGYGIEEDVNFKDGGGSSQIDALNIEGGIIESGGKGGIVITDDTKDHNVLVITGGASGGTVNVGKAGEGTTETPIDNFLPKDGEGDYHVTVIKDENGKDVTVVSSGKAVEEKDYTSAGFNAITKTDSIVKMSAASELITLTKDVTVGEIAMVYDANKIIIPSGMTLKADHIIMNGDANITIKAGGKLIITGKEGIKNYKVTNLVIEDDAIFLVNPENVSNKHPYATVKQNLPIKKNTGGIVGEDCAYEYIWQNIGLPTVDGNYDMLPIGQTMFNAWDRDQGWIAAPAKADRKPFEGLHIASTADEACEYSFAGALAGNMNYDVDINKNGYYLYANSWTAPLKTSVILNNLATEGAGGKITAAVYFYQPDNKDIDGDTYVDINEGVYTPITPTLLNNLPSEAVKQYFSTIKPLEGFFIVTLAPVHFTLSYKDNIWASNVTPAGAPRVESNEAMNAVRVRISAENGRTDYVYLNDAQDMSAAKMMNARPNLNVYAQTEDGQYGILSTETLEGVMVNFQTNSKVNYTMTFDMVEGETYYMKDNLSGAVVEMVEGNLYHFVAEPNSNIENRFEVIAAAKAPTAMQKTNAAVKAIKTMVNGSVVISNGQRFVNMLGVEVK